jgi:hypothetical protein
MNGRKPVQSRSPVISKPSIQNLPSQVPWVGVADFQAGKSSTSWQSAPHSFPSHGADHLVVRPPRGLSFCGARPPAAIGEMAGRALSKWAPDTLPSPMTPPAAHWTPRGFAPMCQNSQVLGVHAGSAATRMPRIHWQCNSRFLYAIRTLLCPKITAFPHLAGPCAARPCSATRLVTCRLHSPPAQSCPSATRMLPAPRDPQGRAESADPRGYPQGHMRARRPFCGCKDFSPIGNSILPIAKKPSRGSHSHLRPARKLQGPRTRRKNRTQNEVRPPQPQFRRLKSPLLRAGLMPPPVSGSLKKSIDARDAKPIPE